MVEFRSSVLPPSSLDQVLSELAMLTNEQFEKLNASIHSAEGFDTDTERLERLARTMDLTSDSVAYFLQVLSFLYNRLSRLPSGSTRAQSILKNLVEGLAEDAMDNINREVLLNRLIALVKSDATLEAAGKIRRLKKGFLPNLRAVSTFVDIRPNFDGDGSKIEGLVPLVQVRVLTDADDPTKSSFIFQLDERGLQSIKKALDRVELKLNTLKSAGSLESMIRSDRDK